MNALSAYVTNPTVLVPSTPHYQSYSQLGSTLDTAMEPKAQCEILETWLYIDWSNFIVSICEC